MEGVLGFASDYDGTLTMRPNPGVGASDVEAIRRFREAGGVFGIDTGRCRRALFSALGGRVPYDFAILSTGALIVDGADEVIFERRMSREVVTSIVRHFVPRSLGLFVVASNEYWTTSPIWLVKRARRRTFNMCRTLRDVPEPLYGIAFRLLTKQAASDFAQKVNDRFGDVACAYQNERSVDVAPAGCSKASGLEIVRRELGITCMGAMGDSYNDLPMFGAADVGYTFPDAPVPVRGVTDVVASSVGEALADFVQRGR